MLGKKKHIEEEEEDYEEQDEDDNDRETPVKEKPKKQISIEEMDDLIEGRLIRALELLRVRRTMQ